VSTFVIGFCRFSFLGRGDWVKYRTVAHGQESDELFQEVAADLYAPERMERRFEAFEKITLPSILSQSDVDFRYCVISSAVMPKNYRARLAAICARSPCIQLIFAETTNLAEITAPILQDLAQRHEQVVQFRLDDDDAIARRYVELVHEHSARFADKRAFAITFAQCISSVSYPGENTWFTQYRIPFQSAASIVKFQHSDRCIFEVGHFAMQQKYTHIHDNDNFGAFLMKWPSDSRKLDGDNLPRNMERIGRPKFNRICRENFPGLDEVDFDRIARGRG